MQKDIKNPCYRAIWRSVITRGLQSADADKHRDRIARFGVLKHRAKQQENYLWSIAAFDTDKDTKDKASCLASKAAHKLNECGNYLLFKKLLHLRRS